MKIESSKPGDTEPMSFSDALLVWQPDGFVGSRMALRIVFALSCVDSINCCCPHMLSSFGIVEGFSQSGHVHRYLISAENKSYI